jgi:predicted outer membrane protein
VKNGVRVALFGLVCWPLIALAAEPSANGGAEQMFVTEAMLDGMAALEISKLAQSRSPTPGVKKFGADAARAHGKINAELASVARAKNLIVPTELDDERARLVHSVSTKPPSEFDTEYLKRMTATHEDLIVLFQNGAGFSDKELAGVAKRTLPALQQQQTRMSDLPAGTPAPARSSSTRSDRVSVAKPKDPKAGAETPADAAAEAVATDPAAADHAAPEVMDADDTAKRAAEAEAAAAAEKARSGATQPR